MKGQIKEILLVTGSRNTQASIARQLYQYIGNAVHIVPYTVDEPCEPLNKKYFTVFSSDEVYGDFLRLGNEEYIDDYIIVSRIIIHDQIDKILMLPRTEKILMVNDSPKSAEEGIECLKKVGFDFLKLIPYYPGCHVDLHDIKIAISPGEIDKIPKGIEQVYDIGVRILDFSSLIKVLKKISVLDDDKLQNYANHYIESVMDFAKRVSNMANEAVDLTKTVREEIIGKGYYAKYQFDDIIGTTEKICSVKEIAKRIAKSDLTVLIEGENGTGKELFASAIHNTSNRVKKPFVAINLSALPDELIESELFGYEEGSFTGARKGGKIGLFQQANGGTIFLDEIGDISLKIQAKLLRVIQEKEIMKVGGDRIIPVDVRIIAATNRDLKSMVENGTFRKDLYFRLKMGHIYIPPLRERKQDVPELIRNLLKHELDRDVKIDEKIMKKFMDHVWPGNVRELFNVIQYAATVCENDIILEKDLPYDSFVKFSLPNSAQISKKDTGKENERRLDDEIIYLIQEMNLRGELASKRRVMEQLKEKGFRISDYKFRKVINQLISEEKLRNTDGNYGMETTQFDEIQLN
ncbi:MAG: sigma 54-interacting transcriptional regulator [Firmicutes bacterium]|nr:sigma 54-interacting transcriptional regulator [Bacillota bacterium]